MATNHTTNYQLNQWEPTDQVLRTDFNADNAKLDAALAGLDAAKADREDLTALEGSLEAVSADLTTITFGSYTGDGEASRTISLGFTPKAVLLMESSGRLFYSGASRYYCGGLAIGSTAASGLDGTVFRIVTGGFQVYCSAKILTNGGDYRFHYIAFS